MKNHLAPIVETLYSYVWADSPLATLCLQIFPRRGGPRNSTTAAQGNHRVSVRS